MRYVIVVMALLLTAQAHANEQGDSYIGAQVGLSSFDIDGVDDIEIPYYLVRLGIFATRSLALEVRYGNDIEEDTISGVDYAIDRIAGAYATYHFELNASTSVYGLLGYSEIDLKAKSAAGSDRDDETSTSYGFGLDLGNFNFEFLRYLDRGDDTGDAVSLGYTLYFN